MNNPKKIFTLILLCSFMTNAFAFTPLKKGKVVMIISLNIKNFSEWKKGFDAGAPIREKAGIKVLSVCFSTENKNQIVVIEEAESAEAAHDFLTFLKSKHKEGDMNKMDVKLYDIAE